jgi:hypothetical protein
MAHFAQIDENNIVTQVIVVANEELLLNGVENETKGIMFCKSLLGEDTKWVQTSYSAFGGKYKNPITGEMTDEPGFRKNFASIGFAYDSEKDSFIPPKPEGNWILNEDTFLWEITE